jgi:hypothetical protein
VKKSVLFVLVAAVASICSGQWLERQVVFGDTLGGVGLTGGFVTNPVSGNVYIESDPTQVFNPVTREKLRGPGGVGAVVFSPASGKGYVASEESLFILDAAADTVIGVTTLPEIEDIPTAVGYSPTSNRVYFGFDYWDTLLVFDPDGDSVLHRVGIKGDGDVRALLWDSTENRLFVGTDSDSGSLAVLDCAGDSVSAVIGLGMNYISRLALSPVSRKLYCAGRDTSGTYGVFVVSTDSLRVVDTVPGLSLPDTMVYNPITDRVYCLLNETLYVVDCRADTLRTARITGSLSSVAVSTATGRTYLGRSNPTEVLVTDTNDQLAGVIPIPTVPTHNIPALTFRPGRNEVYGVTSGDLVFVVDAEADTLAGTLNYAAITPRQTVHNPAGNKLYLLCPSVDDILVFDSTFGSPKHIFSGSVNTYARPVLNPVLNRLYVADDEEFRVIDCGTDSLVRTHGMYGISHANPVIVPYLNKLYVFSGSTGSGGDSVYAYDCFRDTVTSVMWVSENVPSAVYEPRSNRVFFACRAAPTLRALDPVSDRVVKTFDLVGASYNGKMALNLDLGRLYYTDQSPAMIFTIDLLADSVIASESLPLHVDSMFLDRRLQKLYLCSTIQTLVFDCALGAVVDTINAGFRYSGLMDDRNDKLYLNYGAVVDCRYDSVVTRLDSINPRSMAWDAIDNRVFKPATSRLYVYRDDPYGVEEQKVGRVGPVLSVLGNPVRASLRLRLQIPRGQTGALTLYDAAGRRVHSSSGLRTSSFDIDVRSLSAGIYFVRLKTGMEDATAKVIVER